MKKPPRKLGRTKHLDASSPLFRKKNPSRKKYSQAWLDSVALIGDTVSGWVGLEHECCGGILSVLFSIDSHGKPGVGLTFKILASNNCQDGDFAQFDSSDLAQIDTSDYQQYSDGTWGYAAIATKHYLEQVKGIVPGLDDNIRSLTNAAGIWRPESVESTVVATDAGAYKMVTLGTLTAHHATVGIGKVHSGDLVAFGAYTVPNRKARVTNLMPLPAADSYALEVDIERKSGQTTFWINDTGLDMGVLDGFKGGAHFASWGGGTLKAGDHMLSGRFTDCALGSDKGWRKADLSTKAMLACLPPHITVKAQGDSFICRDLRSSIA